MLAKGYLPDDGGIERYSREMAQAYAALGHSTYVLTQCSGPLGVWRDGDVTVENVGQQGGQALIFLRMLRSWRNLKRHLPADVVHATTWRVAAPFFVSKSAAPLVITIHGREVLVVPWVFRPLMRHFLRCANVVAAVSPTIQGLAQSLVRATQGRWVVVWNGLSFFGSEERKSPEATPLCIYTFCRLVKRKGVDNALRAIAELARRGRTDFRYVIAGDGPTRASLSRLSKDLGLEDRVTFLGRIADDEICNLYRKAGIFLHPQIAVENGHDIEGFGLTIADAMSFGVVAVAGKEGGPADFIRDGETGFLVNGRSPQEIANTLERLLDNTALRQRTAEKGRQWVLANLSWKTSAAMILKNAGASRQ
jgi:phosphatidylinositol alpha-1,6-mannosyltransferase